MGRQKKAFVPQGPRTEKLIIVLTRAHREVSRYPGRPVRNCVYAIVAIKMLLLYVKEGLKDKFDISSETFYHSMILKYRTLPQQKYKNFPTVLGWKFKGNGQVSMGN